MVITGHARAERAGDNKTSLAVFSAEAFAQFRAHESRYVTTVEVAPRISAVVLPPAWGCVLRFQIYVCPGSGLSYQL